MTGRVEIPSPTGAAPDCLDPTRAEPGFAHWVCRATLRNPGGAGSLRQPLPCRVFPRGIHLGTMPRVLFRARKEHLTRAFYAKYETLFSATSPPGLASPLSQALIT